MEPVSLPSSEAEEAPPKDDVLSSARSHDSKQSQNSKASLESQQMKKSQSSKASVESLKSIESGRSQKSQSSKSMLEDPKHSDCSSVHTYEESPAVSLDAAPISKDLSQHSSKAGSLASNHLDVEAEDPEYLGNSRESTLKAPEVPPENTMLRKSFDFDDEAFERASSSHEAGKGSELSTPRTTLSEFNVYEKDPLTPRSVQSERIPLHAHPFHCLQLLVLSLISCSNV
jgi:hypothetical protein